MANHESNDLDRTVQRWAALALISLATGCGLHERPDVDDGPHLGGAGGGAGGDGADVPIGEVDGGVGEAGAAGAGGDGAGGDGAGGASSACEGTPCGFVCADLSSDPLNCGACGHDCGGSACSASACEATTLAEGSFESLAISAGYLYLIDVGGDPRVARVPVAGGPVEPISGVQAGGLYRLAADDAALYGAIFFTPTRSEFWRAPLASGGFTPEEGGVLLGEARSSAALAVNASALISLEARPSGSTVVRDLTRFDKTGGTPGGALIASVEPVFADALALDDEAAFVVKGAEGPSFVVRVPLDGSGATTIADAPPGGTLFDVSVARDRAVFASDVGVGQASTRGGEAALLTPQFAYRVRADSERAYYFTRDATCEDPTDIYRVPLGGGVPFRIGREPVGCIVDVVQDADALYWLTPDGRSIRRLAKD